MALALACSGSPDLVAREEREPSAIYDPSRPPGVLPLTGDLDVHDPGVVEVDGRVYLFDSGVGLPLRTSDDLLDWRSATPVFASNPAWIAESVPDATNLWSPDVLHFGGEYHLYYAASTFRSARSCVGHASTPRIDGPWTDRGPVVCSNTGATADAFNAIDPSVALDGAGVPWLAFGSYEDGLHLVRLDASGARADDEMAALAARPDAGNALQASTLLRRADQFYLFASFDLCCSGVDSTHRIMVGRSADVAGPYVDKDGVAMLEGGGSLLLEGDARWRGPGSSAVLQRGADFYLFFHVYDADDSGRITLRIAELVWDEAGWPVAGGP